MKTKMLLIAIFGILLFSACNPEGKLPQPDIIDILPKLSPDGKKIAFTRLQGITSEPGIYVMNIDGKNLKKIYGKGNSTFSFRGVASWSPNSEKLAYIRDHNLIIADTLGNELQSVKLKFTDYLRSIPVWSKDGKFILCTHIDNEKTIPLVSLITSDLQNQRMIKLSNPEHNLQGIISLSNNNEELLYANIYNIFIADTSGEIKKKYDVNLFQYWYSSPEWDNTQTNIMYLGNEGVTLLNVNNLTERIILKNVLTPSFTPDSKSVIFTRSDNLGVDTKIWIKNLNTNEEYPINY